MFWASDLWWVSWSTLFQRCYRAMYDYEAADTDEVSFKDGDLIINCTAIDEGWMTGTIQRTGVTGMLPANYVERVSWIFTAQCTTWWLEGLPVQRVRQWFLLCDQKNYKSFLVYLFAKIFFPFLLFNKSYLIILYYRLFIINLKIARVIQKQNCFKIYIQKSITYCIIV